MPTDSARRLGELGGLMAKPTSVNALTKTPSCNSHPLLVPAPAEFWLSQIPSCQLKQCLYSSWNRACPCFRLVWASFWYLNQMSVPLQFFRPRSDYKFKQSQSKSSYKYLRSLSIFLCLLGNFCPHSLIFPKTVSLWFLQFRKSTSLLFSINLVLLTWYYENNSYFCLLPTQCLHEEENIAWTPSSCVPDVLEQCCDWHEPCTCPFIFPSSSRGCLQVYGTR